jgi:outer membrane protein assembly factor BamE
VASISTRKPPATPRVLALSDEQRKALPVPARAETPAEPAPAGPARTYPPLEPQ